MTETQGRKKKKAESAGFDTQARGVRSAMIGGAGSVIARNTVTAYRQEGLPTCVLGLRIS
ncbi:MAG: hypothetical protein JW955_23790 [Sedimentisphaerales bacterium]|nr:hypothetical protein [Sedimentisphaerales bacterium]